MLFRQFPRLIPQITYRFVEARRRLIAEFFFQFIKLTFGPGTFGNRLSQPAFVHGTGRPLHIAACFLHLLLHLLLRLFLCFRRLLHAFRKFISVTQHLPLFITQPFELTFNFFALSFRLCRSELTFELFQAFVHHLLSLSQFFQPIEHLQLLSLLLSLLLIVLLLSWLLLRLVAVAFVIQFQLLQLLLRRGILLALLLLLSLLLLLLLSDLKFSGAHAQQCLSDFLFQRECLRQLLAGCIGRSFCQLFCCSGHFPDSLFGQCRNLRLLRSLRQRLLQHFNRLSLRLCHGLNILLQRPCRLQQRQLPLQIPRR